MTKTANSIREFYPHIGPSALYSSIKSDTSELCSDEKLPFSEPQETQFEHALDLAIAIVRSLKANSQYDDVRPGNMTYDEESKKSRIYSTRPA